MVTGQPRQIASMLKRLVVLGLLLLPGWVHGQESLVMATEQWPPFRINDPASPCGFRGIDIDIVNKLAEELGIAIKIQRHPWARVLEMMRTGQADIVTGVAHNPEREKFMQYVPVSYYAVRPVFYTRKGRGGFIRSYQDLYGKTIGYSLNSAYFEPFDSDGRLTKVGLLTETQLLQVLALDRVEAVVGTDPNVSYDVMRLGHRDVLEPAAYQVPEKTELFFAFSRKSKAIGYAPELERILRGWMADGTIDAILKGYK